MRQHNGDDEVRARVGGWAIRSSVLSRRCGRLWAATCARWGVTTPQYAVLRLIEELAGLSSAELARRSFVTTQTVNEVVLGLEAAGLTTRSSDPGGGRCRPVVLTA
jgi:DNA-binding MarR family transcriptional regulator